MPFQNDLHPGLLANPIYRFDAGIEPPSARRRRRNLLRIWGLTIVLFAIVGLFGPVAILILFSKFNFRYLIAATKVGSFLGFWVILLIVWAGLFTRERAQRRLWANWDEWRMAGFTPRQIRRALAAPQILAAALLMLPLALGLPMTPMNLTVSRIPTGPSHRILETILFVVEPFTLILAARVLDAALWGAVRANVSRGFIVSILLASTSCPIWVELIYEPVLINYDLIHNEILFCLALILLRSSLVLWIWQVTGRSLEIDGPAPLTWARLKRDAWPLLPWSAGGGK